MGKDYEGQSRQQALGIIETEGCASLIEAVDSAIKAATVTLKISSRVGGGLSAVTLVGDVGAMRAALDAAKATIARIGAVGYTHLIPRLAADVWPIIEGLPPSPSQKDAAILGEQVQKEAVPSLKKPRKKTQKPKDTSS